MARLARSLAGVVRQYQQAAFTCGLLHAVGELAMHIGMPEACAALDQTVLPLDPRRAQAERRAFGFCYAQVGAGFARKWHFPQAMADALEHQYAPFQNEVYEPLAGVIHLAAWRAPGNLPAQNHLPASATPRFAICSLYNYLRPPGSSTLLISSSM